MYSEPTDLDRRALADALASKWGIDVERLEYMPIGFGSHHWRAVGGDGARWFVSADHLLAGRHGGRAAGEVFAELDRAYRTAAALRDLVGLEFVLAPVASLGGAMVHRLDARYAIRVEPFVEGTAGEDGEFERSEDRRVMGTLLGRLHAASASISQGLPAREVFALEGRGALERALGELDTPWEHGPYAERARELLGEYATGVRDRLRAYDRLARRVRDEPAEWIVTHGEPHNANLIREPGGGLRLVDWETTLIGPRERDLWMTLDADLTGWDEYRDVLGSVPLNLEALDLYRERWALSEIGMYIAEFRQPHEDTPDTRASWRELGEYLR